MIESRHPPTVSGLSHTCMTPWRLLRWSCCSLTKNRFTHMTSGNCYEVLLMWGRNILLAHLFLIHMWTQIIQEVQHTDERRTETERERRTGRRRQTEVGRYTVTLMNKQLNALDVW